MQLEWDKELLIGGEPITSSGSAHMDALHGPYSKTWTTP